MLSCCGLQGVDGMSWALGEAHRRYTNFIHARGRWTGHLFQNRFASVAMDESHLRSAVSYFSLNPVHARLVSRAEEWAVLLFFADETRLR